MSFAGSDSCRGFGCSPMEIIGVTALVAPDRSIASLRSRLDRRGHLPFDSLWPVVVAERPLWVVAAYECWLADGDARWLRTAFDAGRRALSADSAAMFDREYGLMHGVTVYADGSSVAMPRWMRMVDRFESFSLATNAVYCRAYMAMAEMADALGLPSDGYRDFAGRLQIAVANRFWIPEHGCYGPLLYGYPSAVLSAGADCEAVAMTVAFGVAYRPMGISAVRKLSCTDGDSWCLAMAAWAAAEAGNCAVMDEVASRVSESGDDAAAMMALRALAGVRMTQAGMELHPVVPRAFAGGVSLSGIRYRGAELHVRIQGCGSRIVSCKIDGRPVADALISPDMTGVHSVEMTVGPVPGRQETAGEVSPAASSDDAGGEEFVARPPIHVSRGRLTTIEAERVIRGGTSLIRERKMAQRFVEVSASRNPHITFVVDVREKATFFVTLNYADGTSEAPFTFRRLQADGHDAGLFIMPHVGAGPSTGAVSNRLPVRFGPGRHVLVIDRPPYAPPVRGSVLIDKMQIMRK